MATVPFHKVCETISNLFSVRITDKNAEEDAEEVVFDSIWLFSRHRQDKTYSLYRIETDPGTYWDPPTEEYVEMVVTDSLSEVMKAIAADKAEIEAQIALETLAEEMDE